MNPLQGILGTLAGASPRLDRTDVKGLTVSTVNSCDLGYETAIIDKNGTYPVERYETRDEAGRGHEKWCKDAETLATVIKLGYPDWSEDETVTLERN